MYKRSGGKLGRKTGYRKSKEQKQEQYAGVIKLLKKGYPVSQYCQYLRCQNLNNYEIEERVLRVKKSPGLPINGGLGDFYFVQHLWTMPL
jgi:DNA invertase Pin-like site-specific DNA recombinase